MYTCIGISALITPFTLSCISPHPFFALSGAKKYRGCQSLALLKQMVHLHVSCFRCMWHLLFYKSVGCDPALLPLPKSVGIISVYFSFLLLLLLFSMIWFLLWTFVTVTYAFPTKHTKHNGIWFWVMVYFSFLLLLLLCSMIWFDFELLEPFLVYILPSIWNTMEFGSGFELL